MEQLFTETKTSQPPILLIDASYSTVGNKFNDVTVFTKIQSIILGLKESEFKIMFWNSDRNPSEFFKGGCYRIPFVVKKTGLDVLFTHVSSNITGTCVTSPHIAFENIPADWISKTEVTKVYFITDGEMGWSNINMYDTKELRTNLASSIQKIVKENKMLQLNLVAVEPKIRKFDVVESMTNVAGCDVYNVIVENRLTNIVTKFTSFALDHPDGYVNISRMISPPGFIPFQDKYFSELKISQFINYVNKLVQEATSENELLKLVQDLSPTLNVLTKDKPVKLKENIINTFCKLFEGSSMDQVFVKFIMTEAVERENAGTSEMLVSYRNKLKDLFKEANKLLEKDVAHSIGVKDFGLCFPVNDTIVSASSKILDEKLSIKGSVYPKCAFKINEISIPVLPRDFGKRSAISDQCLRQWTRAIVAEIYGVDRLGDIVIYLVLGMVLRVHLSDLPADVKIAFRNIGKIMLEKKRANSDTTELLRLEEGLLPIPNNGKIETFFEHMKKVNQVLKMQLKPFSLWYAICIALDNKQLIENQYKHCIEDLKADDLESNLDAKLKLLIKPVTLLDVPIENTLDYKCIITLDDLTGVGGYRFSPHTTGTNNKCSPIFMISEEGYKGLLARPELCMCPVCYAKLGETEFIKVGKKEDSQIVLPFVTYFTAPEKVVRPSRPEPRPLDDNMNRILIVLKGTVGAGKSTFAEKVADHVKKLGGVIYVEGTDKYCKNNMTPKAAIKRVEQQLAKAKASREKNVFVVIDTCGDRSDGYNYFNTDFTGWQKVEIYPNFIEDNMSEYLSWSLRNVLNRTKPGKDANYFLNPESASVKVCIDVHRKKAEALFTGVIFDAWNQQSEDEVKRMIESKANSYKEKLAEWLNIDGMVSELVEKYFRQ